MKFSALRYGASRPAIVGLSSEQRRTRVIVDLGHLMCECLIRWVDRERAVKACAVRLRELLDIVADPIGLRPYLLEIHTARPLPFPAISQMIDDGALAKIDVEPEVERHRAAHVVLDGLANLRLPVATRLVLGESRYRGLGVHAKRGDRLSYNVARGGRRAEPVVTQALVDMQMGVSMIQSCLVHSAPGCRQKLDKDVVVLSVDVDLAPILRLLDQTGVQCHLIHYQDANLPKKLKEPAASVTAISGRRASIAALEQRAALKQII